MTTELEQEFFRVFGIDEQCICPYFPEYMENGCEICIKYFQGKKDCNEKNRYKYPDITAEKLLEMICILNNYGKYDCWGVTIARLKKAILENCIVVVISKSLNNVILEQFKQRIQQLFKG